MKNLIRTLIIVSISSLVLLLPAKGKTVHEPITTYKPKPPVQQPIKEPAVTPVEPAVAVSTPKPVVYTAPVTNCGSDPYMAYIYQHESGCRTNAVNASSGAYGLCQALPGYKMATAGADWQTSWATQNAWCVSYAYARYGSPYQAYLYWTANHYW